MLTPEAQGGRLSLTFSFVWIIVVSNIITTAFCFLFLAKIARITQVRTSLVLPFILLLIYVGAFAENNTFGDVVVMLVFGALGWVMVQTDWPRPPLILGLVLGQLAEQNLFLTIDNYGMDWLGFPGVAGLFALTMLGIFYPLFQKWREKRNKPRYKQLAEAEELQAKEAVPVSIWFSIFSEFRPGLFPWVVGFLGLSLAFLQLNLDAARAVKTIGHGLVKARDQEATRLTRETVKISAWILGYFAAIWLLGFPVATVVMTFLYLKLAKERWLTTLILAFLTWVSFYGLFIYFLHVPFPEGVLFAWLR
jgi:hypothetical protein